MTIRAIATVVGNFRLPTLTQMWDGLHGPGKFTQETREQRIVRKWLQGE